MAIGTATVEDDPCEVSGLLRGLGPRSTRMPVDQLPAIALPHGPESLSGTERVRAGTARGRRPGEHRENQRCITVKAPCSGAGQRACAWPVGNALDRGIPAFYPPKSLRVAQDLSWCRFVYLGNEGRGVFFKKSPDTGKSRYEGMSKIWIRSLPHDHQQRHPMPHDSVQFIRLVTNTLIVC